MTLCLRAGTGLETTDSGSCPLTARQAALDPSQMRSSCSVARKSAPKTWDLRAAREGKTKLECVCGISRRPGCCTLLLYLP
jgi:hypothetical protein